MASPRITVASQPLVLDEIIAGLEPEQIPFEFVLLAKVTMPDGSVKKIPGEDLDAFFLAHPPTNLSIRLMFDIAKVRRAIRDEVNRFYAEVYARL